MTETLFHPLRLFLQLDHFLNGEADRGSAARRHLSDAMRRVVGAMPIRPVRDGGYHRDSDHQVEHEARPAGLVRRILSGMSGPHRERRIMLGLTQRQMAEFIGVTYQQAHRYEKGINRIAAGRLYHIAEALGVEVGYFFEELGRDAALKATPQQRLLLELGRNFTAIRSANTRMPSARWRARWQSPPPGPEPRMLVAPVGLR